MTSLNFFYFNVCVFTYIWLNDIKLQIEVYEPIEMYINKVDTENISTNIK